MLKVLKFGGSSLADARQFAKVKSIVEADPARRVVIVSAPGKRFSGDHKITDLLYLCAAHIKYGVSCEDIFAMIRDRYNEIIAECGLHISLDKEFDALWDKMKNGISQDELASRGEYFSARLMAEYLGYEFVDAARWIKFKFDGTVDQIVGVLHQKDFYINGKMTDQPIAEIMTKPLFVYQYTKIRDILKMFQHQKSHIAVVVDDFGGTLGIVTMEDILEELVGEIWDEHDEVEEDFEKLDENTYRVDCSVSLEDFTEFFDIKLESDSVSVGGWVMEQLNRVPVKGDSFTAQNLEITVSDLSAYRVSFITVRQCDVCLTCEQ